MLGGSFFLGGHDHHSECISQRQKNLSQDSILKYSCKDLQKQHFSCLFSFGLSSVVSTDGQPVIVNINCYLFPFARRGYIEVEVKGHLNERNLPLSCMWIFLKYIIEVFIPTLSVFIGMSKDMGEKKN